MGGGYSASGSQSISNSSGTKTSVGPVTFGGVSFGAQGGGSSSSMWLYIVGALAVALLVLTSHKKVSQLV